MFAMLTIQDDLAAFHAVHFSTLPTEYFAQEFLGPVDEEEYAEEVEDDGLGYYEDGVKRTLTDEQIAIFRHSEIQSLLRDRRHAQEAQDYASTPDVEDGELEQEQLEGGEEVEVARPIGPVQPATPSHNAPSKASKKAAKKARKAEVARQKGFYKQNIKPDLRKRTWDKVEVGVGNLDYDEDSVPAPVQGRSAQRRRISYEDD